MKKSLTSNYLSMFSSELAMIYGSGVTLSDGVLMLIDDADKDGKLVLNSLLTWLDEGQPLSVALEKSGYFPQYMIGMVQTGEKTGRSVEALHALSEYYDRQERTELAIKNVIFYPAILLVMMIAVVLVLVIYVLPIFNNVFGRFGVRMSEMATQLMQFGRWLSNSSVVIAVIFGIIFAIALLLWLLPNLRMKVSNVFKDKWGNRGVFGAAASSHFVSVMALSLASGLNTEEAMHMAAKVSGGAKAVNKKNERCINLLRSGSDLPTAMGEAGILSAREVRMLALGDKSGATDGAMAEIARRKERTFQDWMDRIIGRVEPLMVIVISVIVGVILLSVMLPLMGIMNSIS